MSTANDTIAKLTRANIRERTENLLVRERELTERLVVMFQNGQAGPGPAISEHDRSVHDHARRALNGAGSLLAPLREDESEASIQAQREGVRLALQTLQSADLEAEAVEVAQRAVELTPEWRAIAKEWTLAALRWQAIEARAERFRDHVGSMVMSALPQGGGAIGIGAAVHVNGFGWARPFDITVDQIIEDSLETGIATRSEIDRARRGKDA
jgi:hypothetical protein